MAAPSWGTGRPAWGTGTTMAAIGRWETGTGIEPRGGSGLRPSLLKIYGQRETERERDVGTGGGQDTEGHVVQLWIKV